MMADLNGSWAIERQIWEYCIHLEGGRRRSGGVWGCCLSQAQGISHFCLDTWLLPFARTSNCCAQLPHIRRIQPRDLHVATEKTIEYDEVHVIFMKTSMIITNFLSRMDSMKFCKVPTPRKSAELQQNEHTICTTSREFEPGDMFILRVPIRFVILQFNFWNICNRNSNIHLLLNTQINYRQCINMASCATCASHMFISSSSPFPI